MSYLKTTDIVTKLRERTDYSTMLLCDPPRPAPDRLCHDAANEIERLREALAKIAQHDMQAIAMDALRPGERVCAALPKGENDV